MKIIKKLLAFTLSASMVLGASGLDAFAKTEEDVSKTETNTSGIEANKSYLVPLTFYDVTGESIRDYGGLGGIPEFIDNVAIVSKNSDDTYHVTLQIENYNKIDVLQFSKPGVISDETEPRNALFGTYNLPESYIFEKDTAEDVRTAIDRYISEEWNEKYIQNVDVQTADTGVSWYSFDVDSLEKSIYVKSFRSYGYKRVGKKYTYASGIDSGKFTFDLSQAETVNELSDSSYKNAGLEISKVSTTAGEPVNFYAFPVEGNEVNDYFAGTNDISVDNQKMEVSTELKNADNIASVQVLNGINDLGDKSTSTTENTNFLQYKYAYSAEQVGDKTISVYSDNILSDGKISLTFSNLQEAVFGKQIKVQTTDGKTYYGEARIKSNAKKDLRLTDGGVTVITDSYNVGSDNPEFKAELLEENTDEDSEYNKYFSLLAGSSSKALIYNLGINVNGTTVKPTRAVELRVKIPEDWDTSKIEVQWYGAPVFQIFNPIENFGNSSYKNEDGSIRMDGDELVITGTTCVYNTLAISEKSDKTDISEIKDGVYNVNVTMWQQAQPDRLSMSNSAVVNDSARLVVENGRNISILIRRELQSLVVMDIAMEYSGQIMNRQKKMDFQY